MWQYDKEKCIICGAIPCNNNPETAITFEHIIPESLGNRNFGGYFLCKKCNGKLGELVDAKLCNNSLIASIRLYFNLAGKSGRFPRIQGKVGNIENASIINGKLRLPDYLREVEDGKFKGSASTMGKAISMITKTLQRRGYLSLTRAYKTQQFNGLSTLHKAPLPLKKTERCFCLSSGHCDQKHSRLFSPFRPRRLCWIIPRRRATHSTAGAACQGQSRRCAAVLRTLDWLSRLCYLPRRDGGYILQSRPLSLDRERAGG